MRSRMRGFTLVELMITLAIVAILASIAVPNYRSYVMRSQRSEATGALLRLQSAQEKYFLQYNTYSANVAGVPPAGLNMSVLTDGGHYNLTLAAGAGTQFTATATATGSQTSDTRCQTFTINQNGVRTSTPGPTTECWR